jgi:hypothetical protein
LPTYRNDNSRSITYNNETWAPGEIKAVKFSVPEEKGLTELSIEPRLPGTTLAAGKLTLATGESERIYIPECDKFLITIIADSGSATIQENYQDNPAVSPVDSGLHFFRSGVDRVNEVEAYWVTAGSGGAVICYNVGKLKLPV